MLQVAILFAAWNRFSGNREASGVYRAFGRMALLGLALGAAAEIFRRLVLGGVAAGDPAGSLLVLGALTLFFLALLALAAHIFGIREILEPAARWRGWLARRLWEPGSGKGGGQ
jgi:hypothetical protein